MGQVKSLATEAGQLRTTKARPRALPGHAGGVTQPTITRIDFFLYNQRAYTGRLASGEAGSTPSCRVLKYAVNWTATTPPVAVEINPPIQTATGPQAFDLDTALAILAARGWTVRRWRGPGASDATDRRDPYNAPGAGARAWRGAPQPVRDRAGIAKLRRRAEAGLLARDPYAPPVSADFAFDY